MMKEKIISLYRDVERFLKSDEYTDDLREQLQQSNPDYLTVLEKRIKDIERVDHGIVIAGIKSSNKPKKSFFVNNRLSAFLEGFA